MGLLFTHTHIALLIAGAPAVDSFYVPFHRYRVLLRSPHRRGAYDLHCGNAVMRSLAAAYGISVIGLFRLVAGDGALAAVMLAAPSSARHSSILRALTVSCTGAAGA